MPQPPLSFRRSQRRPRALLLVLVTCLFVFALGSVAHANPYTQVALTGTSDGTSPFDADNTAGNDADDTNGIVRTYDSVGFDLSVNVNSTGGTTENWDVVTVKQMLPVGLHFSTSLPAICNGAGSQVTTTAHANDTLTCNYAPAGGGQTGTTLNFSFSALVDGAANGTTIAAVLAAAHPVTTTVTSMAQMSDPAPSYVGTPGFTVSSAPRLDLFKQSPQGALVAGGYNITYQVGVKVPTSSKGLRGYYHPVAPITFVDDFSLVSPGATFVSFTGPSSGSTILDNGSGGGQTRNLQFTTIPNDPSGNGNVATATLTLFVPNADVPPGMNNGQRSTTNVVKTMRDGNANPVPGESDADTNNSSTYNLITQSGSGGNGNAGTFRKDIKAGNGTLADGSSAYGQLLPSQYTGDDGNGQVQVNQFIVADVSIGNASNTAPVTTPGACDVWDNTRMHLSIGGDPAGPAAHGNKPAWFNSGTAQAGTTIEYSTDTNAGIVDPADATRWTAQKAFTDCSTGTWSTTPPADLTTVTRVRILEPTVPAGSSTATYRLNFQVVDSTQGDTIANFLGSLLDTTWTTSSYDPATNANVGRGQRVFTNGISVRVRKRSSSPSTTYGTPANVVPGTPVQFELIPTVTAVNLGTTPVAHNVIVKDRLPAGLVYDDSAGHAPGGGYTPTVTQDGGGQTVLTWTIPSLTLTTSTLAPHLTFWVSTPITTAGNQVNESIISSTEDVASRTTFPAMAPNPIESHYSTQTVAVASAGGVQISKQTLQSVVEPLDPLAFRVTYANLTNATQTNIDIVDILPDNGDGRTSPTTSLHGTAHLDATTPVDAPLATAVTYANAPVATLVTNTNSSVTDTTNHNDDGGVTWCDQAHLGTGGGCPASLAAVTAVRIARSSLGAGGSGTFTLHLAPTGNRSGDRYANNAVIRYGTGHLGARSNTVSSRVVASRIGDYTWKDTNKDGKQDVGEPVFANVPVSLSGTDKFGRAISLSTSTDASGLYLFTSSSQAGQNAGVLDLVSGTYTVTFGVPAGWQFTTQNAAGTTTANDSNADPLTGQTMVTMPNPAPTGIDGENLTLDAGYILAPVVPGGGGGGTSTTSTTTTPADDPPVVTTPTKTPVTPPKGGTGPSTSGGKKKPKPKPKPDPDPELTIKKTADATRAAAGAKVRYTIVVRNVGEVDAHDVRVCDDPGKGLILVSQPKHTKFQDGKLCWSLDTMDKGSTKTFHVTMSILATLRVGKVVNRVAMTADGATKQGDEAVVQVDGDSVKGVGAGGGGRGPGSAGGGVTG